MSLTYQQAKLVKETIPILSSHGDLITTIFYRNLLNAQPSLSAIFNNANQLNGRQPRALTQIILTFAQHIHRMSELAPILERVCHKHVSLNISPADYDIVGKYLLGAFSTVLGPTIFTTAVAEAWERAYNILARMLSGREAQLYASLGDWVGFRPFRIMRKVQETRTRDVFSLYLVPVDGSMLPLPAFKPGQYVSLQIPVTGYEDVTTQTRQYSLSDKPRGDYYRITLKREINANGGPGMVSSTLIDNYGIGDIVQLSHPTGDFFLDMENSGSSVPVVLISAGVGVAPMISILNSLLAQVPTPPSTSSSSSSSSSRINPISSKNSIASSVQAASPSSTHSPVPSFFSRSRTHSRAPSVPSLSPANRTASFSFSSSRLSRGSVDSTSTSSPEPEPGPKQELAESIAATATLANHVVAPQLPACRPITWIHGSHADAAFDIYIRSIAHMRRNFHSAVFKTAPEAGDILGSDFNFTGRVDLDKISDADLHLAYGAAEYFICGPEGFMLDVRKALLRKGVDVSRIKCELFNTGDLLANAKWKGA
ncbi:Flavohemoprotein [Ceratocystis platani]|uniref:nitric oxide dioxygenase n=1 Tax=Ceratocystis fimbriata f. sp. platani TaxID=88771 RepID=A0A0F8B5C2_CERFI|nr:Flavohemoprotein [Ceratocystis platani]